jgi:FKBP-type peptidyl-prolyl cis-trans isomerase
VWNTSFMNRLAIVLVAGGLLTACSSTNEFAAPPADALKTPSGLASKVLRVGLGQTHPSPQSTVTVHYTGWTADGKMFESSTTDGKPITFRVTEVIQGWVEGLQLMRVGEKRRFWIPGALAYDNNPRPDAPKGMLVFDIELIRIH